MSDTDPYAAPHVEEARFAVASEPVSAPEEPVEAAPAVEEAVPEGSIKEVLKWVGYDREKAQRALAAEHDGEKRTTLVSKLEAIID